MMMCKQLLGVQKQTANIGVLLELGRVPLSLYAIKSAIKNWERIKSGNTNSMVSYSYKQASEYNLLWLKNIQNLLERNGLACFFQNVYQTDQLFVRKHNNFPEALR